MQERALASWTPFSSLPQPLDDSQLSIGAESASYRFSGSMAGLGHDLSNVVTALQLCADLIGEPGVLTPAHAHLARELSAVVKAAERLTREARGDTRSAPEFRTTSEPEARIENLGGAVRNLWPLLAAVAGRRVDVQIAWMPCPGELQFSEENLSRVLVNLVRNAADAMPSGGWVRITVQRGNRVLSSPETRTAGDFIPRPANRRTALLTVEDNGEGIDPALLEYVFEPGFSTRRGDDSSPENAHRGLGLSVVRQLVEAAGGVVTAQNRPAGGARFLIELPLTNVTPCIRPEHVSHGASDAF